jgi:hypothetical protein
MDIKVKGGVIQDGSIKLNSLHPDVRNKIESIGSAD